MTDAIHQIKQLRSDYATVFKSARGRAVLRDLMARFNVTRPHLTSDPHEMFFAEGQRSVVLHILTFLRLSDADIEALLMRQPTMYDEEL